MSGDFYIFGGTFDPMHEGHVGVIRELQGKNIVIAPTESNPLKGQPTNSLADRIAMIEKVLTYEKIQFQKLGRDSNASSSSQNKVQIAEFPYRYVCDFVAWWRKHHTGEIIWVVGPDLVEQVKTWKNWDSLNIKVHLAKSYADNLRSTDVREHQYPMHPALKT